jgi:NADPH-dependent curcumin reductase CurA
MTLSNRQFLLAQIPQGKLGAEHFRMTQTPTPVPGDGEVLVRVRWIALDAANRSWMLGASYRAALTAGQVMAGAGLAEVVDSRAPGFEPGDWVYGDLGWQEYASLPAPSLRKVGRATPMSHLLSIYGVAGLTAYFGLLRCGQPKAGETVVVSAAAGAVGSIAGQIARIKGCRTVGIAGGPDKCALIRSEFGFDAAVDYKSYPGNIGGLYQALQVASQGGIDVYFDNVGGETLEACLFGMKLHGRVVACGAVSMYDGTVPYGVRGLAGIVSKRVTLRGFIVSDFYGEREQALYELKAWVDAGQIKVREDIIEGLENLPAALIGLLAGANIGKRIVKVA